MKGEKNGGGQNPLYYKFLATPLTTTNHDSHKP